MGDYKDGTYTGIGQGYNGPITLKVTISDNQITGIEAISQAETPSKWELAKQLFQKIVNLNSTEVDAVSSATDSSSGIKEAVNNALAKAAAAAAGSSVFEAGSGSKEDPYIIADSLQLEQFAQTVNEGNDYKGNYIELSGDLELKGEWTPAGKAGMPFAGFFSGKGHTISGLSIQANAGAAAGLFGVLAGGSKISDLKLENVNISRTANAGEAGAIAGKAGDNSGGVVIDHCQVQGTIEANNPGGIARAGGIAGNLGAGSVVSNVYADVSVTALSKKFGVYAGGLIGVSGNKCILVNSASTGAVFAIMDGAAASSAGGAFGLQSGTAYNVFSNCTVTAESVKPGKSLTGGISGMVTNNTGIINCYFNDSVPQAFMTISSSITKYAAENVSGLPDSERNGQELADRLNQGLTRSQKAGGINRISQAGNPNMGNLEQALASIPALYGWNYSTGLILSDLAFVDDSIDAGIFESGSGTKEDPYILKTEAQLRAFAASLSDHVTYSGYYIALGDDVDVSGESWQPIGLGHYAFEGTLDGQGHKITGMRIGTRELPYEEEAGANHDTSKITTYYGLFGVLGENAVIKNLGIEDAVISVRGKASVWAGLLAGLTDRAYVDSCYASGYVSSETTHKKANAWAGGLVGQTFKGGIINSWTHAEVFCTAIGGLAESGAFLGLVNRSVVANSFALGNAEGKASRDNGSEGMPAVSSFIAVNGGKVANCYALGDMKAASFSTYVGSFSGWSTGIAREFISYYNADAVQDSNGTVNNPVIGVGNMVSAGVTDEGVAYDGTYHVGIEAKDLSFMRSQAFADRLNSNFNAFPMDLEKGESSNTGNQNAMGLPGFMKLKKWQLENGIVMPAGETVATVYVDMTPVFEPDTLDVADGTYYGRSKGPGGEYIYVEMTVANKRISDIMLTKHSEGSGLDSIAPEIIAAVTASQNYSLTARDSDLGKALKNAIAAAAKKAAIRDTTGYGAAPASLFAGGTGTKEMPYLIKTPEQMAAFAGSLNEDEHYEGKYVRLENNLSLKGMEWLPAGGSGAWGFRGSFDGNNKVISDMTIGSPEHPELYCKSVGLFANLEGARVKNLGIENASIYRRYLGKSIAYAGLLSGYYAQRAGDGGYVDFCYAEGSINSYTAKQNDSGGLIGAINRGTVANSYARAEINCESRDGYAYAGGVSALPNRALIINNYALGRIWGKGNGARIQLGGISGMNAGIEINNYANVELVSANTTPDVGGFSGRITGIGYVERAYYNSEARQLSGSKEVIPARGIGTVVAGTREGKGTVADLEGKSFSQLNSQEFAEVLNTNKEDGELLKRAGGILEMLGEAIPSEIILRDFQYSPNQGGVIFRDRAAKPGDVASGRDSSDDSSSSAQTKSDSTDRPVKADVSVTAKLGENGSASVTVSDQDISQAITRAQAEARTRGKMEKGISVAVNVALPKDAGSLTAAFSNKSLERLVNANVQSLDLNGTLINIGLNKKAMEEISGQIGAELTVEMKPVEIKGVRGSRDITFRSVKNGQALQVTNLKEGAAVIGIPCTPGSHEIGGRLYGVYVDGEGKINRIANSVYDVNTGQVLFQTNHFSVYGVGYMDAVPGFEDTQKHWARDSVDYAAGRGLLSGSSALEFAPDAPLSRETLAEALGKLAEADMSSYTGSSLTDVAGRKNAPYMEWAQRMGIMPEKGLGLFEPDAPVTREEMAVIMENYARATGFSLPAPREPLSFGDQKTIGSGAAPAVTAMEKAGVMMGERDGMFRPKDSVTRAQAAAIMERYIKLVIDPRTTDGWAKNDSGQYLYYRHGAAVTGTQSIGGITYHFSADGSLQEKEAA